MAVVYINRQTEERYLKSVKVPKCKGEALCYKKHMESSIRRATFVIPIGFEFYEFPNAKAVLKQKTNS